MENVTTLHNNLTLTALKDDISTTYGQYKASKLIWQIGSPILLILGTVGNCLSILVFSRRSLRTSTTALFLTVLALSDLLVLYSGLLRQWLLHLFNKDVRYISVLGCKINIWLVYSSLDFSAWILIFVTLERLTSAWFPHSAKRIWTKTSAVIIILVSGIFLFGLNAHLLYGMIFKTYTDAYEQLVTITKCVEINTNYFNFFNHVWPWIDLCVFSLIPFSVIVIGNVLTLYRVNQSQKKANSRVVPSVNGERNQPTTIRNKISSMTVMLFTLNIEFLITTLPICIYNIYVAKWMEITDAKKQSELDLWWAIVNMFMYMNNSLNFLLYCFSGTRFRREVVNMFCSIGNRATSDVVVTPSNYTRTIFGTSRHSETENLQLEPTGSDSPTKFDHNSQPKNETGHTRAIYFIEENNPSSLRPRNAQLPDGSLNFVVENGISVTKYDSN